ncbi:MAG: bifunctional glutamate N-acetyltransferase/amino-acid acetyltransferase ArgJ [Nitrospiraceae bacterium]
MKRIRGGITAPRGFQAAGIHCGIKKPPGKDLAIVLSEQDGPIAGVFTTNRMAAAPVILDRQYLRLGVGRAIIVNSGNANACTGAVGLAAARKMSTLVAKQLRVSRRKVFVGSTGVIGQPLPLSHIERGLPLLMKRARRSGGTEAARAILTTDRRVKQVALYERIGGRTVTIGGMAKGSGMIHPNMATMLAYLTTDVCIDRATLQAALKAAVDRSFNCISVDGDTSTNDTVLCLANDMAANERIQDGTREAEHFRDMLTRACWSLAMQVCRDGEGVTKVVRIVVSGARSRADARCVAQTIATSSLVKTAFFGEDANWGRVMAAIGRSGVLLRPQHVSLTFDEVPMVTAGVGLGAQAERRIAKVFRRKEFTIHADLGPGAATAEMWTTDLSYDYVKINASYRS